MKSLADMPAALVYNRPTRLPGRRYMVQCGVTVLLREGKTGLETLMMRRAKKRGDPWSGDMCFPGGRLSKGDADPEATAHRELEEEIGFSASVHAKPLGRLSELMTRAHEAPKPMSVSPYVLELTSEPDMELNHEAVEVIWIPLSFLANPANREKMNWKVGKANWSVPCYHYQGCRIWGLSLMILDELVEVVGGPRHGGLQKYRAIRKLLPWN